MDEKSCAPLLWGGFGCFRHAKRVGVGKGLGSDFVAISRKKAEKLWLVASVLYGFLRSALVWKFLAKYGVNPYLYLVVELSSSYFYGLGSARVVVSVVDRMWPALRVWVPVALAAYFAPEGYIFLSAGTLPTDVLGVLLGIIGVAAVAAGFSLVSQIKSARKQHEVSESK